MNAKSLTIAIPTFQSNDSLERLLSSLLEYPKAQNLITEILICDNDPNSLLGSIIESEYKQKSSVPIRYLKNDSNLGYDGNLYKLSQECKTNLIKFIADDELVTIEFFHSLEYILFLDNEFEIILQNFQTHPETTRPTWQNKKSLNRYETFGPKWDYKKIGLLHEIYGQVSTLTFNNKKLRTLAKPDETNYIHIFWFFSILENSSLIVDWASTITVSLGSPNFSQNLVRKFSIPKGGVKALQKSYIEDSKLKRQLVDNAKQYCLHLLLGVHEMTYSQKFQVFRVYAIDLLQEPIWILRLLPRFAIPSFLAKKAKILSTHG